MKEISQAKRIATSDNLNIYYWVNWNRGLEKGFVFLHPGSSMNHSSMEPLENQLNQQGKPTVVFDPRGFGYSDAPTDPEYYSLEHYSDDLQKIIEQEGLEQPALLGHSFGFMPAADYIARTANANSLIGICASHNFAETSPNRVMFHLFDKFGRYGGYLGSLGTAITHKLKREQRSYPDQSQLRGKSDFSIWLSIVDVPFKRIRAHTVSGREINKWDVTKQVRRIAVPVLLIYGDKDHMVKAPKSFEEFEGNVIYHSTRAVPKSCDILGGTHSWPMQCPEAIARTIKDFYETISIRGVHQIL